ncbi:RidA family protein [Oscillibacter sp. 1-3]|jgi:2-iminobutanoate/2-iminopropanoate deaminase|uniref:RidA family protein n=1 Tax=Oscillibacter sp. 1-3 TaxID=1235797 RepID=UPI00033E0BF7|nr:RidA family protein [Oscillibacter sp. 1-3]EOS63719.1 TdcF protein [Oscillibacter sp. 1-3]
MKTVFTPKAPAAIGPYSQAIGTGDFLFISGQTGLVPGTGEVSGNTVDAQAEQCCQNVQAILEANGMGFENVVKTTCFLADMADFSAFNAVYEKHFVSKPARSCVAVRELPKKLLCEIEVIAVKDETLR